MDRDDQEQVPEVILSDEEGQEHRFEVLAVLEDEDDTFVIMAPEEQSDEEALEVMVFRMEGDQEEGDLSFAVVDDEMQAQAVLEAWERWEEEQGQEE